MPDTRQRDLKNIVILGGGSAGWMTAAALSSLLSPKSISITLVESEAIGTVGVGEATIPDIINFNALLGINEAEFVKATNGTFKLGIEFINWGKKGESYFHPFGTHGVDMQGIDFHQYWLYSKHSGDNRPIQEYSICALAAEGNKFTKPDTNPRSPLSHLRYAYHIDATEYARYLRGYAEERGVNRVEGKVIDVTQDKKSGDIKSISLENGKEIPGDFFFDCTGFRALLSGKTLETPFIDWSHWLPCDTAQTVASESASKLLPYTKSTAHSAGWQWRIPTQTRTGNGHIYASDFIDDMNAIDTLLAGLDTPVSGTPRKIKFRTGCLEEFWRKNCIAIGLSAGFLEPLESTSLYLIQMGISRFISLFPTASVSDVIKKEYNTQMMKEFTQVRDFIILHYKATERDDSPFWNYCRTMDIPDSLKRKIDLFREAGRVFRYEDELFSKPSWIAVCLGQNIVPKSFDPIVGTLPIEQVRHSLSSMHSGLRAAVSRLPEHESFVEQLMSSR